ncbi:MAG: TolC family protein [Saprospiraceae bacterium]|nr:TolC family protein [Saprospiraceae bacterium]
MKSIFIYIFQSLGVRQQAKTGPSLQLIRLPYAIISTLLLLISSPLSAQSLEELVELLQAENPSLEAMKQRYLAVEEQAPQVSQLPQPEIGIGAFVSPVETRLGAQQARFSVGQMFPWFGTLDNKAKLVQTRAQVEKERIGDRTLDLKFELKSAYFQLYQIRQTQVILERKRVLLDRLRNLALNQIESGTGSGADVLRVELQMQALEQEIRILRNREKQPLANINHLLKRALLEPISTPDTLEFAELNLQADSMSRNLLQLHPRLLGLEKEQEVAQQALLVNKLEGKPTFGIGADYILLSQRTDADPSQNGRDILQVSAKLSIPLYRKRYEAKEREEKLKIEALNFQKEAVVQDFLNEIDQAMTAHEEAALRLSLYQQQIETTQTASRFTQAAYANSGSRFDELLHLEQDLIQYDLQILKAIVNSHLANASIERYLNY